MREKKEELMVKGSGTLNMDASHFNTLGGLGPTAVVVYKRIAALISERKKLPYNVVIRWVRCHVSFSLLRSTIMLLRGSRQKIPKINFSSISVTIAEGRVS